MVLKAKRQVLRQENDKWPVSMREVPHDQWPDAVLRLAARPLQVWRSRYFLAVLWQEPRKINLRLSICRAEIRDDGSWRDGLTWEDLQDIKSGCGFGDVEAVEMYPRDCDVVNVANMRHLWLLAGLSPFAWRSEQPEPVDAVDPHLQSEGTPSTRAESSLSSSNSYSLPPEGVR